MKSCIAILAAFATAACTTITERSLTYHKLKREAGIKNSGMEITATDRCEAIPKQPDYADLNQYYNLAHESFCQSDGECTVNTLDNMLTKAGIEHKISFKDKGEPGDPDIYVRITLVSDEDIYKVADLIDDESNGFHYYRHISAERYYAQNDDAYFADRHKEREEKIAVCYREAKERVKKNAAEIAARMGVKLGDVVDFSMVEDNARDVQRYVIGRRLITSITYTIDGI
jgi:hypothetical protein